MRNSKIIYLLLFFVMCSSSLSGQALRGTTGLLHAPTAEMEKDKTFKFGVGYLDLVPLHYSFFGGEISHTYNYYFNITLFPWLEVSYLLTLNYAQHGSGYFPPQSWGKYTNQDRSFNARIRVWKEGDWKWWMPQIVLGLDDPTSHSHYGGGSITIGEGDMADNHFTRYYLAATKHIDLENLGMLGAHVSIVKNIGMGSYSNSGNRKNTDRFIRPALGANFRFNLPEGGTGLFGGGDFTWQQLVNSTEPMIEYDARTINIGSAFHVWKDRINAIVELNDGKYFSAGIYYKVQLK